MGVVAAIEKGDGNTLSSQGGIVGQPFGLTENGFFGGVIIWESGVGGGCRVIGLGVALSGKVFSVVGNTIRAKSSL